MNVINWEAMTAKDKCHFIESNQLKKIEVQGLHWLEIAGLQITHKHDNRDGANEEASAILREWKAMAREEAH